jgi:midasin
LGAIPFNFVCFLQETIYAFMQFPSGSISGRIICDMTDSTNYEIDDDPPRQYSNFDAVEMLKKLADVSTQMDFGKVGDKVVST